LETPAHNPVDWAQRYLDLHTPWDRGHAHGELVARIASGQLAPPRTDVRAYVPGCGRGYDAVALARAGWRVTAVDIVEDLAGPLRAQLEPLGGEFHVGDALLPPAGPFELVWEHTFLCALRPDQRSAWARMVHDALVPGGRLAALIFPANKGPELGGPPWGYDAARLAQWLGEEFELLEATAVDPTLEPRDWDQAFALFRRR
jgi:SAM-dependent methyltransferase